MNFYQRMKEKSMTEPYKDINRPWYFNKFRDYILCNKTCTVLVRATGEEVEMEPELYDEFKRELWREEKNQKTFYDRTLSYNVECEEYGAEFEKLIPSSYSTEDDAMYYMAVENICRAMSDLSQMQQKTFHDMYFRHLPLTEIADKYGISKAAVCYHIRCAKEKIWNALMPEREE